MRDGKGKEKKWEENEKIGRRERSPVGRSELQAAPAAWSNWVNYHQINDGAPEAGGCYRMVR